VFRVKGLGLRVQDSGLRRAYGLGFRVEDLGFRV
jgi:hypothetical protein